MRKRILSALLVLALAFSLLPASALAVEQRSENPIETVNFYYRNPGVVPEDYNWEDYYPLRNVFTVKIRGGIAEADRNNYTFAVKAGNPTGNPLDGAYKEVSTVYFDEPKLSTGKSNVAYFEVPAGVLQETETFYTVRVTGEDGSNNEESIQLVKVTFKDNAGTQDITKDEWSDADKEHILIHNSESFVFVSKTDGYPALPNLADKEEGPDNEFIGWAEEASQETNKLIEKIDKDTTLYAVFGERANRVLKVRTQNNESADEVSYQKPVEHEITFGAPGADNALSLYVRNEGNRKYEKVYTVSTDHFDMSYEESDGCTKNQYGSGRVSYDIAVDKALEIKFTPKANIPVGEYTDRVPLNNSTDRIIRFIDIKLTVTPIEAEITAEGITKKYGETKTSDDVTWTVEGDDTGSIKQALGGGVSFSSDGFGPDAAVKEDGYDIELTSTVNGNYTAKLKDGQTPKVTVEKATPRFTDVAATSVKPGAQLNTSKLTGTFTNPYTNAAVAGELAWTAPDTAVDAEEGSKTYQWTFTPEDETNYNTVTGYQLVVITEGEPTTVSLKDPEYPMTVTYNGEGVDLSDAFQAVRGAEQTETVTEGIVVQYREHQDMTEDTLDVGYSNTLPKDAGLYDVRAAIPGTEKYAAGYVVEHLTILPKELTVNCTVADKEYDGKQDAEIEEITVVGKIGEDDVSVNQETSTAVFESADAGEGRTVTVTPGELTGTAAENYTLAAAGHVATTATIRKKPVTLQVKEDADLTKTYGELFVLNLTEDFEAAGGGLVDGESLGVHISGEFSCDGVDTKAEVKDGGYPITFIANGGNYDVTLADGAKLTVEKATPKLHENTIQTSTGWSQGTLESVSLTGEFVNSVNSDMIVQGDLVWKDPDTSLSGAQDGKIKATWQFTPSDTKNYVDTPLTGETDVTVSQSQLVVIKGVDAQTVTYNGQTQVYNIEGVTTEPEGANITLKYRRHTDTDTEHQNTENFAAGQLPRDAGAWDVMVLATPDDTEQYIANSVIVHLNIEKARPDTAGVGPFSAREGTLLSELPGLPTTLPGVNGETVAGEFTWSAQNGAVTEETAQLDWSFIPTDSNYTEVGGKATVTMAEDTRTVTGTVYNLPEGYVDYITVALPKDENALKAGETVHFYSDAACETLLGTLTVPADVETAEVTLGMNALGAESGKIYAKIDGRKTQVCEIDYDAALGLNLANRSIYVNGTVDLTPAGEGVTAVYTVAEGADVLEAVDGANGTFKGLKAGTAKVNITATWPHPDATKTGATVQATGSVIVTVTERPTGGGGSGTPSPSVTVKTDSAANGSFTVSDKNAKAGDTVKVTPKANTGYVVDQVKVTDKNGKAVSVKDNGDGTYSFVMPEKAAQPVTVKVTFKEEEQVSPSDKFTDVDKNAWYIDAVNYVVEKGLMEGTGTTTFAPNATTTRAMVVTILYRLEGEPSVSGNAKFGDVASGQWYAEAVAWANANGIVNGYGENKFGPDDNITREQMAAILYRYAAYKGLKAVNTAEYLSKFQDRDEISSYAVAALEWAVGKGLIQGTSNTTLNPVADSTRAQIATVLMRFCEDVAK